jgi:hypothetical protein
MACFAVSATTIVGGVFGVICTDNHSTTTTMSVPLLHFPCLDAFVGVHT